MEWVNLPKIPFCLFFFVSDLQLKKNRLTNITIWTQYPEY